MLPIVYFFPPTFSFSTLERFYWCDRSGVFVTGYKRRLYAVLQVTKKNPYRASFLSFRDLLTFDFFLSDLSKAFTYLSRLLFFPGQRERHLAVALVTRCTTYSKRVRSIVCRISVSF